MTEDYASEQSPLKIVQYAQKNCSLSSQQRNYAILHALFLCAAARPTDRPNLGYQAGTGKSQNMQGRVRASGAGRGRRFRPGYVQRICLPERPCLPFKSQLFSKGRKADKPRQPEGSNSVLLSPGTRPRSVSGLVSLVRPCQP